MKQKKEILKTLDAQRQKDILPFLKELRENNQREWFNERKDRYLAIKEQVEVFAQSCIEKLRTFDLDLSELTGRQCTYRIYRDTRFSKDKSPYKSHIGVFISKRGTHGESSGYYIHFEPGKCIMGAGVYGLEPNAMKKIRQQIYFKSEEFKKILANPKLHSLYGDLDEEGKMKMAPKGFDKDFEGIELLKYRYYFLSTRISDQEASSLDYVDKVIQNARILLPFNKFLNEALAF